MTFDAHANLASGVVSVAPTTPTAGLTMTVVPDAGVSVPTAPFSAVVAPTGALPSHSNAEIVRVSVNASGVWTQARGQEGTTARAIQVGDVVYIGGVTAKTLTDIESAISAETARAVAVEATLQPLDSDLTAIAALGTTTFGRSILAAADAAGLRTLAALGTAATQASSAFDAAGAASAAQAASQPLDADLTAIAALTTTSFGRGLLALANAPALLAAAGAAAATHASQHASAGGDPVTIAESQVTNLTTDLAAKAPLASPALTGSPTAPTQAASDNTTKIATTAYADANKGLPAGLTGATVATRFVGGTVAGAPASGTFALGDFVVDQQGVMWFCTTAGVVGGTCVFTRQGATQLLAGTNVGLTAGGTVEQPTLTISDYPPVDAMQANGELALDSVGATADSSNYGLTPASGAVLFKFFRAKRSWTAMKWLHCHTLGTAPSGLTLAKMGLFSYDGSTTLTRMDVTADAHTTFTGTFAHRKLACLGGSQNIAQGALYALALLQVGTTPGSLAGTTGYPANAIGQSADAWKAALLTGQSDIPTSVAIASLSSADPFFMFAGVTTS